MSGKVVAWEHGLTVEGQRMPRLSYSKRHNFGKRGVNHGGVVDSRALVLATDYAALQAKLDAVTKDAEALRAALNPQQWTSAMSTAWHLNIPDVQTAFDELAKAALTDQGRAGEGRGDG